MRTGIVYHSFQSRPTIRNKHKSRQHGRAKREAIRLELEQLDERTLPSASPILGTLSHAAKGDNHHALVDSGTHQPLAHNGGNASHLQRVASNTMAALRHSAGSHAASGGSSGTLAANTRAADAESSDGTDGEVSGGTDNDQIQDGPGDTADNENDSGPDTDNIEEGPGNTGGDQTAASAAINSGQQVSAVDSVLATLTGHGRQGARQGRR